MTETRTPIDVAGTGEPGDASGGATQRHREYGWEDPRILADAARTMSGLAFLRAMASGELPVPPITATLGAIVETIEEGRVVFGLTPAEHHYNPIGSVHGGVFATLLDSACGCALQSTLPAGTGYTSLDLAVKFLRPMTVDTGPVRCTGEVISAGRRTALTRAQIHDGSGRLLAEASSTCLILRD